MGNLAGWPYWKVISLTGQSGAGTDYQVKFEIGDSAGGDFYLEGHCTNFPQDIRITDDDGTTLLDHWVEDLTTDPIVMYVEVKDDLESNRDVRVYYGKSGETTASDGAATFNLFDDFESYADTAAMLAVWNVMYGTPTLETTTVYEGSHGADLTSLDWMKQNLPITSNFEIVVHGYYTATTNDYGLMIRESDADTVALMMGGYPTDGKWGYRIDTNSGGTNTGIALAGINTWQKMTLRLCDSKVSFWENDTLVVNELAYTRVPYEILLGRDSTYQDLIYIRKCIATEPAFSSAGAEQTPGVTGHPWYYRRNQ